MKKCILKQLVSFRIHFFYQSKIATALTEAPSEFINFRGSAQNVNKSEPI